MQNLEALYGASVEMISDTESGLMHSCQDDRTATLVPVSMKSPDEAGVAVA